MEQKYWKNRYDQESTPWNLKQVSPPIKEYVDGIRDKNCAILIPGCGYGHEALYLDEIGFSSITAIDFVKETIDTITNRNDRIQALCIDFFEYRGAHDLILEQTMMSALELKNRVRYVEHCASLLQPEGKFVGVLFASEFEKVGPPFGGTMNEYFELFSMYFSTVSIKPCTNSIPPRQGNELFIQCNK
jgi:methyl halide transferase